MVVKKPKKQLNHKQACDAIEFIILIKWEALRVTCLWMLKLVSIKITKLLNLCRQVENVIPKVVLVEILNSLMNLMENKHSFSRALKLFIWCGDLINDLSDCPNVFTTSSNASWPCHLEQTDTKGPSSPASAQWAMTPTPRLTARPARTKAVTNISWYLMV